MKRVFVSFSGGDSDVADYVSAKLSHIFAGHAKFFASSAGLNPGDVWLDRIKSEAATSDAVLILLNPRTLDRPWINIEAGAFWISGKPIYPLIHGGLTPSDLHRPLADYQTVNVNTISGVARLIGILSDQFRLRAPPPYDAADICEQIAVLDRGAMKRFPTWKDLSDAVDVGGVEPAPERLSNYVIDAEMPTSNVRLSKDGATVLLSGYSSDAMLFTFDRPRPLTDANHLVVRVGNSAGVRSFEYGLFMKVLLEHDVLLAEFPFLRHSRDEQFIGLSDGYFPYDISWVSDEEATLIKIVLWRVSVDRLTLQFIVV